MARGLLLPPRLARFVALALHARVHHDGRAPVAGPGAFGGAGPGPAALPRTPAAFAAGPPSGHGRPASALCADRRADGDTDPERPRRPQSAYFRFLATVRQEVEGVPAVETVRLAAEQWRALGDEARRPFYDAYAAEKAGYDVALAGYRASRGLAPARPPTAYRLFLLDARAASLGPRQADVSKAAVARWTALTDEEKRPYFSEAARLQGEHAQKVEELRVRRDRAVDLMGEYGLWMPLTSDMAAADAAQEQADGAAERSVAVASRPKPPKARRGRRTQTDAGPR